MKRRKVVKNEKEDAEVEGKEDMRRKEKRLEMSRKKMENRRRKTRR